MMFTQVNCRGLVLLGCGKMGSAMLEGWLKQGLALSAVWVADPQPSDWVRGLAAKGLHLNEGFPADPAIVLVAVKPQMMTEALPQLAPMGGGGLCWSCGLTICPTLCADLLPGLAPLLLALHGAPACCSCILFSGGSCVCCSGQHLGFRCISQAERCSCLADLHPASCAVGWRSGVLAADWPLWLHLAS